MVGSLFLTIAMAWLTSCNGVQSPIPVGEVVYMVGDDAVTPDLDVDVCGPDDEMCSGEIIETPAKPARFVAVEFRVLHTATSLVGDVEKDVFLNSDQAQMLIGTLCEDPHTQLISHSRLLLCSGQEGQITILPANASAFGCGCTNEMAPQVSGLKELSLRTTPCVRADGCFVHLDLQGSATFGPCSSCDCADQTWKSQIQTVVPDGSTFVFQKVSCPKQPCTEVRLLAGLPIIGELFQVNGAKPENVVMMATVHVVDQAGQPIAQTSCTRDCQSCKPPAVCPNPLSVATVESNLEHLQRARELYELARLYERLNQGEVANKILVNVQEVCPHSQIALMAQSEILREAQRQWESIWFTDQPSLLGLRQAGEESEAPLKLLIPDEPPGNGGFRLNGEEADAPVKLSKLDQVLCGYRQACSEGNVDRARKLAIEALAIDPTCFAK
jgi:hypothetical protein